MTQTFLFEELDDATRDYLRAVRAAEGKRMPGMFSATATAFPGCSLFAGLIVVPLTLIATLTEWMGVVYEDPIRVAFLQTAGLLLGGWLVVAFFRTKAIKGDSRNAGHWVYMDARNLFLAYRERITVCSVEQAIKAKYTHNYNEGKYQNSIVNLRMKGKGSASFTLTNELRAEQFVVFINYIIWAREEGSEVGSLSPAELGALARYVARHDVEPRNSEGKLDLGLLDLDIPEVPIEPKREGRAVPSFLPYIVMLLVTPAIFAVMAFLVNPLIRDSAIFELVMHPPTEPRFLREYLVDPRNTLHREEVIQALSADYYAVIQFVRNNAQEPELRDGMIKMLDSLKEEPNQPSVSIRVTERSPEALTDGAPARVKSFREAIVGGDGALGKNREGILDQFASVSPPIRAPEGMVFAEPPPPIGHQLMYFVEPPAEAKNAHFEITYEFKPLVGRENTYQLLVTVEIRLSIDGDPVSRHSRTLSAYSGDEASLNRALNDLRMFLVKGMVGTFNQPQSDPN